MKHQVPEQTEGSCSDNIAEMLCDSEAQAKEKFQRVKKRFLDINSWELFAGQEKAEFALCDAQGNLLLEKPKPGDHVRIKVPGLHNPGGGSYDWVTVETVEERQDTDSESVYIRLRPAPDPNKNDGKTAHFYQNKATSNFIIEREGKKMTVSVLARNELPNTEDLNFLEKLRNQIVGIGGMLAGSKLQWNAFADGILGKDEK